MLLTFWTQKAQKTKLFSFTYKLSFSEFLAFRKLCEKFAVCLSFWLFTLKSYLEAQINKTIIYNTRQQDTFSAKIIPIMTDLYIYLSYQDYKGLLPRHAEQKVDNTKKNFNERMSRDFWLLNLHQNFPAVINLQVLGII